MWRNGGNKSRKLSPGLVLALFVAIIVVVVMELSHCEASFGSFN